MDKRNTITRRKVIGGLVAMTINPVFANQTNSEPNSYPAPSLT